MKHQPGLLGWSTPGPPTQAIRAQRLNRCWPPSQSSPWSSDPTGPHPCSTQTIRTVATLAAPSPGHRPQSPKLDGRGDSRKLHGCVSRGTPADPRTRPITVDARSDKWARHVRRSASRRVRVLGRAAPRCSRSGGVPGDGSRHEIGRAPPAGLCVDARANRVLLDCGHGAEHPNFERALAPPRAPSHTIVHAVPREASITAHQP